MLLFYIESTHEDIRFCVQAFGACRGMSTTWEKFFSLLR